MTARRSLSIAAIAAGAMLALSMTPASAFTPPGAALSAQVGASQVDKVWWRACGWGRCGWGWRRGYVWRGYGWGPAPLVAPGYYFPPPGPRCWRTYYGRVVCR